MATFEERLGLPAGTYEREKELLATGKAAWVILSGKMCSGKDTVAAHLRLPGTKEILSYGSILRGNLDLALNALYLSRHRGDSPVEQAKELEEALGYSEDDAGELLDLLTPMIERGEKISPWARSDEMRVILQKMGSDWLPDEDYLPRSAAGRAMLIVSGGDSVVAAGSRFLPDVELPRLAGAITLRLDVTRETQFRRLYERDGLTPTDSLLEALNHPGELALDDFPHDIRVNNDGLNGVDSPDALEVLMSEVQEKVDQVLRERTGR